MDARALSAREIVERITGSAAFQSSALAYGELMRRHFEQLEAGCLKYEAEFQRLRRKARAAQPWLVR